MCVCWGVGEEPQACAVRGVNPPALLCSLLDNHSLPSPTHSRTGVCGRGQLHRLRPLRARVPVRVFHRGQQVSVLWRLRAARVSAAAADGHAAALCSHLCCCCCCSVQVWPRVHPPRRRRHGAAGGRGGAWRAAGVHGEGMQGRGGRCWSQHWGVLGLWRNGGGDTSSDEVALSAGAASHELAPALGWGDGAHITAAARAP